MSERWLIIVSYSMLGAMLLLGILGFGLAVAMPGLGRWSRRFFMYFFTVLVLMTGITFADDVTTYGGPTTSPVIEVVGFLGSLLISVFVIMPAVYLLHCCGESYRKSVLLRGVLVCWVVYLVLLVIAQFTTVFYYYTPDSRAVYGSWYPLSVCPLVAIMGMSLVGVIRRRDKLSSRRCNAFLAFFVSLTIAALVHMVAPTYLLMGLCATISALSMFVVVVSDQVQQYLRLQQEIARQRASIAVLRMRPHFIHNTMTSIYYLCEQNPKAAQQVTMNFNTYLRKNFDAIAKDGPIPLVEELEHAQAYLAVEQAQFASKLVVDFYTSHTGFRVPPLTLQPLVENAVKHGMTPKTVPLHILVYTRKTESGNEIVVEDSGPGFDSSIADDPRTTLANVRQRLEMICAGTLDIAPRADGGTIVTVTIP